MIINYANKMPNCWTGFYTCLIIVLSLRLSFQIGIKLYGEQVVKRLDFIHLNCTTESVPLGHAIEINVNQESFTIRLLQDKCFSSVVGGQCAPKICQCSARGLWYSHILQADVSEGNIDITCSMVFKSTGILSDSIQVKIIDFSGPKIRTDVEFPIHSGTVVEFICDLERSNKNITFVWDCANKETTFSGIEKNGKSSSNIFRTIALLDDNTSCTCTVNVNGYVATDAIKIYISKNPNIYSNETLHCNNTLHIEMSCTISTELPVYGFDMWTHSFHGTALRYLKGRVKDNQSILTLTNCSYQDAGDYECVAWTKFEGKSYFTNKSIDVYVNSPPVIVSANKIRQTKSMILTVKFCSSEETNTLWSKDKSVVNTAGITHVVLNRTIPLQMYNKTIFCEGYIANLSIISGKAGTYVLRIQNDFGETRQAFSVDVFQTTGLTTTFDFRSVIIGITIVGIVILIISVTVILMKGKGSNIVHIVGPHEMSSIPIYHSAPSSEPVIHIYDDAIPGYLEVIENPSENEDTESDETSTNTITNTHIYEEVD